MKYRNKIILLEFLTYFGLLISYAFIIQKEFSYMGFEMNFDLIRSSVSLLIISIFIILGSTIKQEFWYSIWNIILSYYMMGTLIYYQFNNICSEKLVVSQVILLITMYFVGLFNIKLKKSIFDIEDDLRITYIVLIFTWIIIMIYIIKYGKNFDLKNLLLIDVYKTRALFRNVDFSILGYLIAPISRVILPILCVIFLNKKKKLALFFAIAGICIIYLCGAVKSIFIGIIAIFIFYKGEYKRKIAIYLKLIVFLTYVGILIYMLTGNVFLLDGFVRRVFFLPPKLENVYYSYFHDNYLLWSNTPIGRFFGDYKLGKDLSMYVGENIIGLQGYNANVGILTEGYADYGYIGVMLHSFIFALIFKIMSLVRMNSKFFGIIFVYIYYLNTSFVFPLLLTHGLLFFLIFSIIFLNNINKNNT